MRALPKTLVATRRLIASGELTVSESVATQRVLLREQSSIWQCTTHEFSQSSKVDSALPLSGIGLAHKDLFSLPGRVPYCGTTSPIAIKGATSPLVKRLTQAGSYTLASLVMAEYACGLTGENAAYSTPINPVDPVAAVGGSSSGSGVAVAAGLCYGSLGSDTAGSVRIPAATCGVLGLKPTNGLLSKVGIYPLAPSLDTAGIVARSALDAAQLLLAVIPAAQRKRILPAVLPTSAALLGRQWDDIQNSLPVPRHLRLAACWSHSVQRYSANPESIEVLNNLAKEYDTLGNPVIVELENLNEIIRSANVLLHVEAATIHLQNMRRQGSKLSSTTRATTIPGAVIPGVWYHQALTQRAAMRRQFISSCLRDKDIFLTPVLPQGVPDWDVILVGSPAFKADSLLALSSWTAFVNYLGLPAVVFPIGNDARGRPISVQAIGRPHSESLLLAFAYAIEKDRYGADGFFADPPALRTTSKS